MTTPKRIFVHPYNLASKSSKDLTKGLKGKRILTRGRSNYAYREGDLLINWGSSSHHIDDHFAPMLNKPARVNDAVNKKTFFQRLAQTKDISYVPFTCDMDTAQKWLEEGRTVVVRNVLKGHSGEGIEIVKGEVNNLELDIPEAPLYTMYIPKKAEYRVHIIGDKVIDVQRKVKDPNSDREFTADDFKVRSHANGFIFTRTDVATGEQQKDVCPSNVTSAAIKCLRALKLDFGAVDVIWNQKKSTAYVLEVNTSPGLEGSSVDLYVKGFLDYFSAMSPKKKQGTTSSIMEDMSRINFYDIECRNPDALDSFLSDPWRNREYINAAFDWTRVGAELQHQLGRDEVKPGVTYPHAFRLVESGVASDFVKSWVLNFAEDVQEVIMFGHGDSDWA